MSLGTVFCIDGSGNKNASDANRKRPIYCLDREAKVITRPVLNSNKTAVEYLKEQIDDVNVKRPVLIAADVVIGLPSAPCDVYSEIKASTFLDWLMLTDQRLKTSKASWSEGLIASSFSERTFAKPFVSLKKRASKKEVEAKRRCDELSGGESVYCVDHSAKQVGRASLQFWFEVLVPLRKEFHDQLAVWPFESIVDKKVIVAECYPAASQERVYGSTISKRDPLKVASALKQLERELKDEGVKVDIGTWIHAASSEDEFDMFSTAVHMLRTDDELLYAFPESLAKCRTLEGWMLGLSDKPDTMRDSKSGRKRNSWDQSSSARNSNNKKKLAVPIGQLNKQSQRNRGPNMNSGVMGTRYSMECERQLPNGEICGFRYETNGQDVFHKKCPSCQGGR